MFAPANTPKFTAEQKELKASACHARLDDTLSAEEANTIIKSINAKLSAQGIPAGHLIADRA